MMNQPSESMQLPSVIQLKQAGNPFRLFVHDTQVISIKHAAQERGQIPEQVLRSLLFRLEKGKFVLILVAGPRQIPWKALRHHFKRRRLTLASPTEVFDATGYEIGSVSPFGIKKALPIYLDDRIKQNGELSMGSGKRGVAIIMKSKDFFHSLPEGIPISLFK